MPQLLIMLTSIEFRKCKNCGHEFQHSKGGIIFIFLDQMIPKCPNCGSRKTKIKAGITLN